MPTVLTSTILSSSILASLVSSRVLPSPTALPFPPSNVTLSPPATKALHIIYRTSTLDPFTPTNSWHFYATTTTTSGPSTSALCPSSSNDAAIATFETKSGQRDPQWPGGVFLLKLFGMKCEYKNNGQNAGALWCEGREGPIGCAREADGERERRRCGEGMYDKGYVVCEWAES